MVMFPLCLKWWCKLRYAGENLAKAGSVSLAHSTLMNSIHRSNILNSNYTHVGVVQGLKHIYY